MHFPPDPGDLTRLTRTLLKRKSGDLKRLNRSRVSRTCRGNWKGSRGDPCDSAGRMQKTGLEWAARWFAVCCSFEWLGIFRDLAVDPWVNLCRSSRIVDHVADLALVPRQTVIMSWKRTPSLRGLSIARLDTTPGCLTLDRSICENASRQR